MPTRYIEIANGTSDAHYPADRTNANAAGIVVDSSDGYTTKLVAHGTTKTLAPLDGVTPVAINAATYALTAAANSGRLNVVTKADGVAITLPASTGSGARFEIVLSVSTTAASSIKVANASDYMVGLAFLDKAGVQTCAATANTGTPSTESDTISLQGTSNANGGIKGEIITLEDIAANIWLVRVESEASGTVATPFSASV